MTQDDTLVRKSVLTTVVVVIAFTLAAPFGTATVGATTTPPSDTDEYAVVQGDECYTIKPIGDGHLTAEEFYDYRDPDTEPSSHSYSSHGTRHLQENDASLLFLHEGGDGLSLGVVHDRHGGGSEGGAATMTFTDLPENGEWVVEDDAYADRDDEFSHRNGSSRITWVYGANRTDGGVFNGGLDDEFSITIQPRFNEDAAFQQYDGELTDWQVISGNSTGHERISLNMNQPIEIRSGGCTSYAVSELDIDESVTTGESTAVEATVENNGVYAETFTVPITVDGEVVDEQEVTLEPGETATVSSSVTLEEAGTHTVGVANETMDVTADDGEQLPGFGVGVALAALLIAFVARVRP
ncbi:CARDB domain-containing protein [Haloterrigena salinisoli]|uniref:CARDB domain-containing protein n=1 Tax=Haloterrigena salinisoli TaxID=3132747 RepID=UPI0030CBE625